MDLAPESCWSLLGKGSLAITSKKDGLETAVALAYLKVMLTQRTDSTVLYQPFLSTVRSVENARVFELKSWFASDSNLLANLLEVIDLDNAFVLSTITAALHKEGCAPWTFDLITWVGIAVGIPLRNIPKTVIRFYGVGRDASIYPTDIGVPIKLDVNPYPTIEDITIPVMVTPFWTLVCYLLNTAPPAHKTKVVQAIVLSHVRVQTDPLRRMIGDTVITALWEDLTTGFTDSYAIRKTLWDPEYAFPQTYGENTANNTGLAWLASVCSKENGPNTSFSFSSLRTIVRDLSRTQSQAMLAENSNLDGMSMESLGNQLIMADGDDDSDDDTQASSTTTTTTDTSTTDGDGSDDGDQSDQTTSTTTTTPDDTTPATPPTDDTDTTSTDQDTQSGDTSSDTTSTPEASSEPAPVEDNIAGLSFDTTGETRGDFLYRRGVLALACKIDDDVDFPVSDEVRSLLKSFTEVLLFTISIGEVKDYMKKLGLQSYLEAVSF